MHTCIPPHGLKRSWHSCSRRVKQKYTQHEPSTKMECDYLNGWMKTVTYTKISLKNVDPRNTDGNTEKEEETQIQILSQWPTGKASPLIIGDPGTCSSHTSDLTLVLRRLNLVLVSEPGLVGPVSVYCDWVRKKVWPATSFSMQQHLKLH